MRPKKNWREENSNIKERDIDQWRHKIVIDDETFQQTFVNRTSKDSLNMSIHVYLDQGISFFFHCISYKINFFPKK